ncbi:hypothetical protein ACE7GA_00395 [Roseomonas sp. CCTCC AB2023176]|uniref:hypothetical protein n=1 Tax=Roseomonas sp. CCTCC AB2023176 TaxID=3342640 RepID=UPI0035D84034
MAAISSVYTIARVAQMLSVDEERLHDLSLGLEPEDGCLWVYDTDDRQTLAFTRDGIKRPEKLIADEKP